MVDQGGGVLLYICKVLKCILHGRWFSLEGCLFGRLVRLHMVDLNRSVITL
jgi:hypothetical protein